MSKISSIEIQNRKALWDDLAPSVLETTTITVELKTIKNIAYDIIHDRRHDLDSSIDEVNAVESGLNILIRHLEEVYTWVKLVRLK